MMNSNQSAAVDPKDFVFETFGPLRVSEAIPWLLMATATRVVGHSIGTTLAEMLANLFTQCLVFMAFVAVTHTIITESGGKSQIDTISLLAKAKLMRNVVGKIVAFVFYAAIVSILLIMLLGIESKSGVYIPANWLISFSGMAYPDGTLICRFYAAIVAVMLYLFVISAATSRPVTWTELRSSFWDHRMTLFFAMILIASIMIFVNAAQLELYVFVYRDILAGKVSDGLFYLFYQTSFAFLRLWVTLYILTGALKYSYSLKARTQI